MKFIFILSMLIVLFILPGCGTGSMLCNVPEAENSVVCKIAEKAHTTPEVISQTLLVGNLAALEGDIYTARAADKFVDNIISDLEKVKASGGKITYMQAVEYIDKKFNLLSPKAQAAFVIIDTNNLAGQAIEVPLTGYDIDLLLAHLKKQKAVIAAYL